MSTRMVLSIAFVLFVVLGMLVYITQDNRRANTTSENVIEKEAEAGSALFAANCSQCHGPQGEGAIGPGLNRKEWHAEDPKYDKASVTAFLTNVLNRGQYSPQPGINMPAWSKNYGGPFNEQQIEDVITFITHGDWEEPLRHTAAPNFLADIPANAAQKKQYPSNVQEVLRSKDVQKYGESDATAKPDQKKALSEAAAAEDKAKGAIYQEAQNNKEQLRLVLGNREPTKPNEKLTGMKQLLQVKGCIGCHGFGSAGTTLGPSLTEVGSRRTAEWMYEWIKNPAAVPNKNRGPNIEPWFKEDKRTEYWPMSPTFMPTIQMTDQERQRIVDYLAGLKVAPVVLIQQPAAQTSGN